MDTLAAEIENAFAANFGGPGSGPRKGQKPKTRNDGRAFGGPHSGKPKTRSDGRAFGGSVPRKSKSSVALGWSKRAGAYGVKKPRKFHDKAHDAHKRAEKHHAMNGNAEIASLHRIAADHHFNVAHMGASYPKELGETLKKIESHNHASFSKEPDMEPIFTADFSADINVANTVDGVEYVERPVPLFFKSGEYPDVKGGAFAMSKEEAAQAVADFAEVPIGLSHVSTVLDGHYGTIVELKGEDKGEHYEHSAKARIPKWLDKFLTEKGKMQISASWDRATKKLLSAHLVPMGRIEGAELVAAFGIANPDLAKKIGQEQAGKTATSNDEGDDNQGDDDANSQKTVHHGKELAAFICEKIDDALDHADGQGDIFSPKYTTILKKVLKMLKPIGGCSRRKDEEPTDDDPKVAADFAASPLFVEMTAKVTDAERKAADAEARFSAAETEKAALKTANDAEVQKRIESQAANFSATLQFAKKIAPAERKGVEDSLVQAAKDDVTAPLPAGQKSRFDTLKETYAARPSLAIASQSADFSAMLNLVPSGDETPDQKKAKEQADTESLMMKSEAGRAILKKRAAAAKN